MSEDWAGDTFNMVTEDSWILMGPTLEPAPDDERLIYDNGDVVLFDESARMRGRYTADAGGAGEIEDAAEKLSGVLDRGERCT